jgi:copper(I)-binding protein
MNVSYLILIVTFVLTACAGSGSSDGVGVIRIADAWARPTSGTDVGGVYMTIENTGSGADRLVGLSTDVAESASVHETKTDASGMMSMQPVEGGLEVPANGSVSLKPGGYHVMLMKLKSPLVTDDTFKLTLKFQSGKDVVVDVTVKDI